jgi:acyl carrier protein
LPDIEPVRSYIAREFLYDEAARLRDDDSLFPSVVDSLGIVELVDFLEETYKIKVDEDELVVSNFSSLDAVASLIERKQTL